MKQISIQDLKKNLSAVLREAAAGGPIVITSHNRPVARLSPPEPACVHRGQSFGKGKLRPLFRTKTKGRYMEVLLEDRNEDEAPRAGS